MNYARLAGLWLITSFWGTLSACGDPGAEAAAPDENAANVSLALSTIPAGVQCIKVFAIWDGSTIANQSFTVSGSPWTANVGLGFLSRGSITVSANAFNVACASVEGATPTWVADPLLVEVTPGRPNNVTLDFRQNFGVSAVGNFAPTVVDIALGGNSTGLLLADGTVRMLGSVSNPTNLTGVAELAVGLNHACVRKTDGTVWCWGGNGNGQFGNGTTTTSNSVPVQVPGFTSATKIAVGPSTTCATGTWSGTPGQFCWGLNANSMFRNGVANGNVTSPSFIDPGGSAPNGPIAWAIGAGNICLLNSRNLAVVCGGNNNVGQLGAGDTVAHPTGVTVPALEPVTSLALGDGANGDSAHVCAADAAGRAFCWGKNLTGQLGIGTTTDASSPVPILDVGGVVEIAASDFATCVRSSSGAVSCFGRNSAGGVGHGLGGINSTPGFVLADSRKLRAGSSHFCSLQADASLWCWGSNSIGQLGSDPTKTSSPKPAPVRL